MVGADEQGAGLSRRFLIVLGKLPVAPLSACGRDLRGTHRKSPHHHSSKQTINFDNLAVYRHNKRDQPNCFTRSPAAGDMTENECTGATAFRLWTHCNKCLGSADATSFTTQTKAMSDNNSDPFTLELITKITNDVVWDVGTMDLDDPKLAASLQELPTHSAQ